MSYEPNPFDQAVYALIKSLRKHYVVVGKVRAASFVTWFIVGFAIGTVATVSFVISRAGSVDGGLAAREYASAQSHTSSCIDIIPQELTLTASMGTATFYAVGVENASGVNFAVWSVVNGQDDLAWYPAIDLGGGTWQTSFNLGNHLGAGPVAVHGWLIGEEDTLCGEATITRL